MSVSAFGVPGDADGLNLDSHPGSVVWMEEHWDVIPDKLDEFLKVYLREIYALARQTPGYRGATIATTVPAAGRSLVTKPAEASASDFIQLGAVVSNGRLGQEGTKGENLIGRLAERSVNWDGLFQHAFNVLIIHHIQSWADADRFRARMAQIYAAAHPGERLNDRVALTLVPLATVYWESEYRLLSTSWPPLDSYTTSPGPREPGDADGLNLALRQGPLVLVTEHWDVKPERLRQFVAAYERDVHNASVRRVKGYRGYSIATSLAPQPWEKDTAPISNKARRRLGGSDQLYPRGPSVRINGTSRNDIRINAGALYQRTFTVIVTHQIQTWETLRGWSRGAEGGGYEEIYERENNGRNINDLWLHGLFVYSENHTDMFYRLLATSFIANAATASSSLDPLRVGR